MLWSSKTTSKNFTVAKQDIVSMDWFRSTRGCQLRNRLKTDTCIELIGFRDSVRNQLFAFKYTYFPPSPRTIQKFCINFLCACLLSPQISSSLLLLLFFFESNRISIRSTAMFRSILESRSPSAIFRLRE